MNFDELFDQPNEAAEAWEKVRQLEAALAERTARYEYSAGVLAAANARLLHPEADVLAPYLDHPLVEDATAASLRLAEKAARVAQLEAELAAAQLRVEELEGAADWGRAENERLAAEIDERDAALAAAHEALEAARDEIQSARVYLLVRDALSALDRFREEKPDET